MWRVWGCTCSSLRLVDLFYWYFVVLLREFVDGKHWALAKVFLCTRRADGAELCMKEVEFHLLSAAEQCVPAFSLFGVVQCRRNERS